MDLAKECPASTSVQHLHETTLAAKGKRKMCESELPPPSTPPKSTRHLHLSSPETLMRYNDRVLRRMQTDTCFRCGQQGHWMRDCPGSSQNLKYEAPTAENSDILKIYCRCGHGFCEVRKAKNDRNYGKSYYVCPIKRGKKCRDFVGWCDSNVNESDLRPPPYKYPMCPCGAGVCRKVKETNGENEGRSFFACPIGGGHRACKYRLWEEDALLGKSNNAPLQRTLHYYWDKESKQLDENNGNDVGSDADSPAKRMRFLGDSEFLEGEDDALKKASIDGRDRTELSSPPNQHLDRESMRKAAEDAFDVPITLPVDCTESSEHVWEFINSTSSAAEVQSFVQSDLSLEEHIQHYEKEKLRLANIHDSFVKAKTLLKASQKHSQSLREEASRLKEMLQGVEFQLASCETRTKKIETHLDKINASMLEAEESLKITKSK